MWKIAAGQPFAANTVKTETGDWTSRYAVVHRDTGEILWWYHVEMTDYDTELRVGVIRRVDVD